MNPLLSERNFTPTFTGELLTNGLPPGVTELLQIEVDEDVAGEILMEQLFVAELLAEATTLAVKLKFPEVPGVPVMVPSEALRFKPSGSDPDAIKYVYELTPPLATKAELYAAPTRPLRQH